MAILKKNNRLPVIPQVVYNDRSRQPVRPVSGTGLNSSGQPTASATHIINRSQRKR